jgi:uncharacterized protein (TIGR00290 family)
MEAQCKALGIPYLKVKVKKDKDVLATFKRLKKEGVEAVVAGDIVGTMCAQHHLAFYDPMCKQAGLDLLMPIENPSNDTYDILKEEISIGIKPIINCINLDYFGEEWLGRVLNKTSIKDLKALADNHGIDVCGEDERGYHTMVIDGPSFKNKIKIGKSKKKVIKEKFKFGKMKWLLMDIKESFLGPTE